MTSALTVAQAFLDLATQESASLTNMQLQKLVFFAHGVHLAAFEGKPLIQEQVRAWDFGPVVPELYERLRQFGRGMVVPDFAQELRGNIKPESTEMEAIRSVWEAYKGYSAWELSDISHQEGSPWHSVWSEQGRRYGEIPNTTIQKYYEPLVSHQDD